MKFQRSSTKHLLNINILLMAVPCSFALPNFVVANNFGLRFEISFALFTVLCMFGTDFVHKKLVADYWGAPGPDIEYSVAELPAALVAAKWRGCISALTLSGVALPMFDPNIPRALAESEYKIVYIVGLFCLGLCLGLVAGRALAITQICRAGIKKVMDSSNAMASPVPRFEE